MAFTLNVVAAALLRPFVRRQEIGHVMLYGHKLNSNLKGLYDYSRRQGDKDMILYFLTMDPACYRELQAAGEQVLLSTNPLNIFKISRASVIVSDHGLHALEILLKFSDISFVDVWHGIPFKGFDTDDFRVQQQYTEIWLTSDLLRNLYATKFGFDRAILHTTGYARTDVLVNQAAGGDAVRKRLGITDAGKKIILFAPTWRQDESSRSIYPFNTDADVFLGAIDRMCDNLSVICVFRTHLNTGIEAGSGYRNIYFAPHATFPDTEEILLAGDMLVCDWSSIAFDYLLLDRPTVFLDVPAPFRKGFSLDASYRFGKVVGNLEEMIAGLELYVKEPEAYWSAYGIKCEAIKRELYDANADGNASKRCYERLEQLVEAGR
jgi:CDP-glycerol glycerophosphotransferase